MFTKIPSIKFHANPSSGSSADTSAKTDTRTGTTKAFFYIYTSVLKKGRGKRLCKNGWQKQSTL